MTPVTALPHGSHGSHPRRLTARTVALALDGLFAASLAGLIVAASVFGQRGGETLSDNWILAGFALGAAAAVLAGGAVALVTVIRGNRDKLLIIPLSFGGLTLLFLVGEFASPH